jgi:hypothetical protein
VNGVVQVASRTGLGTVSAGAIVALIGAAALVFVSSVVAFRGWPGLTQTSSSQNVVLPAPASPDAAPEQSVVLGGKQAAANRAPARPVAKAKAATPVPVVGTVRQQSAGAPAVAIGRRAPAVAAKPAEPAPTAPNSADPVQQVVEDPVAPVERVVEPADRDGLAGAADDVVRTLDKIIP